MEWLSAVQSTHRGFVAKMEADGGAHLAPLSSLVSRGIPNERRARKVVDQQFASWREVDSAEYFQAFGISPTCAGRSGHAVYEAGDNDLRVLIPALVIMRAFFRPTQYLLPQMFAPQALDRVRYLDFSKAPPSIEFVSETWRNLGDRYGDVRTPISWMSVFPSAMRFAGSVHLNARSGRIALLLPKARIKIALQGQRQERCLYATNATLLEVDALEEPMDWAMNHAKRIYRRAPVNSKSSPVLRVADIPPRPDGSLEVDDEEWALIKLILLPECSERRLRIDQRGVFNGILRKLAIGSGWRSTAYPVGGRTHALYAYRRWSQNGALNGALAILRGRRSSTTIQE